ncbi:uncharacterized protein LOC111277465 [Durio zibethinus]|uniref:Uncharacterized protein LOC111277465 n=1 Tax=Durio zibethinus TaxID=66656 RepID=A0A6P5WVW1_DURZI|nr:uncharacterized protein LOC111277465 [Durio zibethinus]
MLDNNQILQTRTHIRATKPRRENENNQDLIPLLTSHFDFCLHGKEIKQMPPRWDPLRAIDAPSFGKKKDPANDDSEDDDDLELGSVEGFIYKTLEDFWRFVEHKEKAILNCYEASSIIDDDIVVMIFYDALFIVELLLRNYEKENAQELGIKDFLLKGTWSAGLRRDLLLLENQIPFFVLEELYKLYCNFPREDKFDSCAAPASAFPFLYHACLYFDIPWDKRFEDAEILHFTGLLRCHLVKNCASNSDPSMAQKRKTESVYSATMLQDAGVELKPVDDQSASWLDIKFEGKELKIPKLNVHSNTEAYIRNVMALEMCHYPGETYVCAYIELMNYLIRSDKDVDLLMEKGVLSNDGINEGIIVSRINPSKALAGMIKKLMQGVGEPAACYRETGRRLNKYYKNARKHVIATFCKENLAILKRVYFTNLWRGTGTVAAFMVVVLTLIQTVLTFLK